MASVQAERLIEITPHVHASSRLPRSVFREIWATAKLTPDTLANARPRRMRGCAEDVRKYLFGNAEQLKQYSRDGTIPNYAKYVSSALSCLEHHLIDSSMEVSYNPFLPVLAQFREMLMLQIELINAVRENYRYFFSIRSGIELGIGGPEYYEIPIRLPKIREDGSMAPEYEILSVVNHSTRKSVALALPLDFRQVFSEMRYTSADGTHARMHFDFGRQVLEVMPEK